jgi:hypothetical protein
VYPHLNKRDNYGVEKICVLAKIRVEKLNSGGDFGPFLSFVGKFDGPFSVVQQM